MNIIPVNKVGQGTETLFPSRFVCVKTVRYSGFWFTSFDNPSKNEPSPNVAKARNGIVNPPIRRPIPFNVSLTATDYNPPKIAYELPTIPIIATTNDMLSFKSNIVIKAKDPV